jgi:hypothetical protein
LTGARTIAFTSIHHRPVPDSITVTKDRSTSSSALRSGQAATGTSNAYLTISVTPAECDTAPLVPVIVKG